MLADHDRVRVAQRRPQHAAGVLQRRAIVEAGVLAARVRFWSSEMNRVEANRYFGRKLRVVDVLGGI